MTLDVLARRFAENAPAADFWSIRLVDERVETVTVRRDDLEPVESRRSLGAMITVAEGGGLAYAATGDLTPAGLRVAAERARAQARALAPSALFDAALLPRAAHRGAYASRVERPLDAMALDERIASVRDACRRLAVGPRIVDRVASLGHVAADVLIATSAGAWIEQRFSFVKPALVAVANEGALTQRRTHGGENSVRQGGLEQLDALGFVEAAAPLAEEAVALLDAPPCPEGVTDLVLLPGQMVLQIHESIGHPLELDRILGDERNYAGGSFVTLDMFGSYRYGSELLDVAFDPTLPEEAATYGYDDEGTRAERAWLIRKGVLERPLGGALSQARAGAVSSGRFRAGGVACARASGWQRPAIDRMGNLNLEPGSSTLAEIVGSVERGVLMDHNRSWSIDDRRDKFQFGCEIAREIRDGEVRGLLRDPGYRGRAANFWRSLAAVGRADTVEVWGPANCGKGEPNQVIPVGHASPPCLFRAVEVFGG
jgi:predicted Zn-dependent protease